MDIEAVLLTGGASLRMGEDKASVQVDGVTLGARIALGLQVAGVPPTVLGREPLRGFPFLADKNPLDGPLAALRDFRPEAPLVFVSACDMPLFDPRIVTLLRAHLGEADAAVPFVEGRLQPLCALYRASALARLSVPPLDTARSMMAFLDALRVVGLPESSFAHLTPRCLRSANSPQELETLLQGS